MIIEANEVINIQSYKQICKIELWELITMRMNRIFMLDIYLILFMNKKIIIMREKNNYLMDVQVIKYNYYGIFFT